MTIQQMADRLHRPYNQVWKWMLDNGLIEVKRPDYSKFPYSGILTLYTQGWYIEDIAEKMGRSENFCRNVIYRIFRTRNVPQRSNMNCVEPDSYTHPNFPKK